MPSELSRLIGQKITRRRKKLMLSQDDLRRKANLSSGAISEIEAGNKHPQIDTLVRITVALGTSLKQLTGY